MAEKKLEDLPPVYSNLGFDADTGAGPSAPTIYSPDVGEDFPSVSKSPTAPPPPLPPPNLGPQPLAISPPSLVFEEIYDACVLYVKNHCCYGSKFINQMKLTEITNRAVYQYKLESFGEKRETSIRTSPYKGGPYDSPNNGPEPAPWSMAVSPYNLFKNDSRKIEIPHTTTVHTCTKCDGSGRVTCDSCWGRGRTSCFSCSGSGRNSDGDSCSYCLGSGSETCSTCSGSGRVTCSRCDGYGELEKCKILTVTWRNHPIYFITDTDSMPSKLILEAEGTSLFQEEDTALQPLLHADDITVNAASLDLLAAHRNSFPGEMIIRQRHVLRGVPFTRVKYQWKEREGEFYVYGKERKVHFEDYPQQCCCCTCC